MEMNKEELELCIFRLGRDLDLYLNNIKREFISLGKYDINLKDILGYDHLCKSVAELVKSVYD